MTTPAHANDVRTVRTVCASLGVPGADWPLIAGWVAQLDAGDGQYELDSYVEVMIADRCYRTTDDVLSELIKTGVDGLDLTTDEIVLAVRTMLLLAHRVEKSTRRT